MKYRQPAWKGSQKGHYKCWFIHKFTTQDSFEKEKIYATIIDMQLVVTHLHIT